MGSIPLVALNAQPPPSTLDTYAKILGLKNAQEESQQRAALMPGQQQLQQGQIIGQQQQNQIGAADVQLKNIQVKDQQLLSTLYPQFTSKTPTNGQPTTATTGPTGYDFDGLKEAYIKGGGSMAGLGQINQIQSANAEMATKLATAGSDVIKNEQAKNSALNDGIESLQAISDPQERMQAMPGILANLQKMGVDTSKLSQIQPTDDNLAKAQASLGMHQQVVADATKLADLAKTVSQTNEADTITAKNKLEMAVPTQEQLDTFTKKTLPSFTNVSPAQRAAFAQQATQARTVPEFNKVLDMADATDKAMQLHADSLAQTKALVGNKFEEAGLTANEKLWNDPQRGYAGTLAQGNQIKASIQAGTDGNALLTNMVPSMEVMGLNHAAGINRISPVEAAAAGVSPDWATRWNSWATKAATGKITPELAKEGRQLVDIVQDAAYQKAVRSAQLTAKGHSLAPSDVPAMQKDGTVTTLDKVVGSVGSQNAAGGQQGGGPASSSAGSPAPNEKPVYHNGQLLGYTTDGKTLSRLP